MAKRGYVYILASGTNGTLYVGVTSDLVRRVWEHRQGAVPGFTSRYHVHRLVYFEEHADIRDAIEREKRLKKRTEARLERAGDAEYSCHFTSSILRTSVKLPASMR